MQFCFRVVCGIFSVALLRGQQAQPAEDKVNWAALFRHSSFMLGTQHGFRLATEEGTRKGMQGAFFPGWYNSLSNLHGWSDGDGFLVNYVGHPMQGSSSAFIWVQNDGRNRYLEFGNNRQYWKSRLRATFWSWAYSTQFEIGPISEASIGKIQSRYPQQGFVDHVATPTVGLAWMLAEDVLDKFVIRRFEERFENNWARMMMRGWLNPTRTFANLMRWKEPWYRDSRKGIYSYRKGDPVAAGAPERKARGTRGDWKSMAPVEFTSATGYWMNPAGVDALHCIGGLGTLQYNSSPEWSWIAEVGGCKMFGFEGIREANFAGDVLTYGVGRRRTWRNGRLMPYAQLLAGGKRITINEELIDLKAQWQAQNPGKRPGYELHRRWTRFNQANGFALQAGAGLELGLNDVATLKLLGVDYNYAWLPRSEVAAYPNSFRVSMGFKLRMGNW
jgi:hypothetical protein